MRKQIAAFLFMGFALLAHAPGAAAAGAPDPCLSERQEWASHYQGPALAEISGVTPANEQEVFLHRAAEFNELEDLEHDYSKRGANPVREPEFLRQVVERENENIEVLQESLGRNTAEFNRNTNTTGQLAEAHWVVCMTQKFQRELPSKRPAPQTAQQQQAMNAPSNRAGNGGGNNNGSSARNTGASTSGDNNAATNNKPKPKTPSIAEIANHCVSLVKDPKLYGGFQNSCGYPISISWCAYHPTKGAWSEAFDCDHDVKGIGRGGLATVGANQIEGDHTNNAEKIFWFACRRPAYPVVVYTAGAGFYGHCK